MNSTKLNACCANDNASVSKDSINHRQVYI